MLYGFSIGRSVLGLGADLRPCPELADGGP